jgi:cyclopropane fatty-acyl-phospholipid synthase-like methyltransferase
MHASAPAAQVVDVGCGVGGPLRAISEFSGAAVWGVNNNEYQARQVGGRLHARARDGGSSRRALPAARFR